MFATGIRCGSRATHKASDRRHVDDSAAFSLLEHLLDLIFQAEPHTFYVDIDDAIKIFFRLFRDWHPQTLNTRVVESNVHAAEFVDGFLYQRLNVAGLCDVGFYEEGFASCGANKSDCFLSLRFAAAGY